MPKTEKEYKAIVKRITLLLQNQENIENHVDKSAIEFNLIFNLKVDNEETYFTFKKTALTATMKLKMIEHGLNQKS